MKKNNGINNQVWFIRVASTLFTKKTLTTIHLMVLWLTKAIVQTPFIMNNGRNKASIQKCINQTS